MLLFIGIQILKTTSYRTDKPKFRFDLHYPMGRDNDAQTWFCKYRSDLTLLFTVTSCMSMK